MSVEGEIRPGQRFEWCACGTEGWPHAYARIELVKIISYGEEMPFTEADDDKPEAESWVLCKDLKDGSTHWNELTRFREAASPSV